MSFETTRSLDMFQDILTDRYNSSDFVWMSRSWQPIAANPHTFKTSPRQMKEKVLASPCVQHVIDEACEEQNVAKEQLYKTVQGIVDEIGNARQLPVIRWLGLLLLKVMKRTCNGLCVNEASISRVTSQMGSNPVIFAPSHRSYGDFILMSYLCYHYNIDIPAIAAGMDFYSMWLMGRLLRDSCAFFMRRSFGSDKVYWTAFSDYVQKLVMDGDTAIEFFIEGTRSRSAKSLVPKFGLLSMTLVPFFTGRVPDVTIVPINISYDRTLEEVLFAYELLGVPKPKESTSGLIKALNMLNERYGKVHVDFAEPISVWEMYQASKLPRSLPTPASPQVLHTLTPEETAFCADVGYRVVQQQQRHTVISAFNLVAIMLNNSVLEGTGPPLLSEVVANVSWFKSVMEVLGALVDIQGSVEVAVRDAAEVHKSLVMLTQNNQMKLVKVHTPTRKVDASKLKGHSLSDETMDVAVPMMMVQHYVNPCLHYLIGPAMVTLVMRHLDAAVEISRDDLFVKFDFLRKLFSSEFALHIPWAHKEFEDALKQLEVLSVVEHTTAGLLRLGNHLKLQVLLSNLLRPFLEGYLAVCQVLHQTASEPCSEKLLVKAIQKRAEEMLSTSSASHPYSLSLDMYAAALQSLTALQAVQRFKRNGTAEYQGNRSQLQDIALTLEGLLLQSDDKFHHAAVEHSSKHFVMQAKL